MFILSRTDVPVVGVGTFDEVALSLVDPPSWAGHFVEHLRTARAAGSPVRGNFLVAENVALKIFGDISHVPASAVREVLQDYAQQFDGLIITLDRSLPDDAVRLE